MPTSITAPSGAVFGQTQLYLARMFDETGIIRWDRQASKQKNGVFSNVQIGGREEFTTHPDLLFHIGVEFRRAIFALLVERAKLVPHLIGIPTAGTALAFGTALSDTPYFESSIMREVRRQDSPARRWVNGTPDTRHWYFIIDNEVADGTTKRNITDRLYEDGYPRDTLIHLALIDRGQGASQHLARAGIFLRSLFTLYDLVFVLGELGLWRKDRVRAVEHETESCS